MHDDPPAESSSWWSRAAGGREVLAVSTPLVVSALSWTVMTFIDRVMLRQVSGEAMSAAFSGGTVWFNTICLPMGVTMYVSTFVSQYYGAGRKERIGASVWQGVWVALLATPALLALTPLAPAFFTAVGHTPATTAGEIVYFQVLLWGAPAMLVSQAFSAFYSGQGRTNVVMAIDAVFALVNLVLDYLWIYGHAGFPAMGIEGAGWGTVVALWIKAITYAVLILQPVHREQFGSLTGLRFDRELFGRMIYYGGPSGVQLMLDVTGFTFFILLVGKLGAVENEATSIAFSISTLAFMPIWGLSMGASILVGQHLGEDRDDLAARSTWTTLHVSLAYMSAISMIYLFVPGVFLQWFFSGEGAPPEDGLVHATAVTLLRFVAAYNLLDATMMVFVSAIKGAGDTRFVLLVSLIMATVFCTLSWLAVTQWNFGVYACWALITGWVWTFGVIFLLRFLQGKWRTMRVIERSVVDSPEPDPVAA